MANFFYLIIVIMIVISCKKEKAPVPTSQPPAYIPLKLDSSSFTIGNSEKGILDTFVLNYNKPISVNHIRLISSYCLPSLKYSVSPDGKMVKFYELLCGELGRDFRFEISVQDLEGTTRVDTADFSYYSRRMPVEGQLIHYFITPDNKFCWVSTHAPDRLYCYGIDNSSYKRVYDLPFKPGKVTLNPHNQKLYALNYFAYTTNTDKVYVMDPATGKIDKTITIAKDSYDDPQKRITVSDLAFGYNGYGIIKTGTIETGPARWRIIDSRLNDTTYAHPEWIAANAAGNLVFKELFNFQENYNKTRIYMKQPYSQPRGAFLDCNSGLLTEITYLSTNPNHYIVPSKTQEKLFVASYGFQGILNNGNWGNYSQFDNRDSETADFSYRPGEEDIIYYRNRGYSYEFMILDYRKSKVLMKTNVPPVFNKIKTTTDGKYMIAVGNGGLFLYNTNLFYKYI